MTDTKASPPEEDAGRVDASQASARFGGGDAFPVVGIGASAGGLEAINQLLAQLPDNTGMAFVLVVHLDPKHESKLDVILSKSTKMPVADATHGTEVRPNHVYVIPPNTTLTIAGGLLQLAPRGESRSPHLPVDAFFKALAADRQTGAIGVVLSGAGSDGRAGLEDIKAVGGITLAQDQSSAKFEGMPQSAVQSGCVDLVLTPEGIARELARIGQHPYVTAPPAAVAPPGIDDAGLRGILSLLQASFGVDFSTYRDTTIRRRIMRRMVLQMKEDLADYQRLLEQDRAEVAALYQDILINVTSFFREPETFDALKQSVFPEILKHSLPGAPIRIWVPGCSTGQEPYSLAIALFEFLEDKPASAAIQIFASDLSDTVSLQKAREGVYPENIAAEVSPERLHRFFIRERDKYRIKQAIRDVCVFAKQNVTADPPFSHVDLISCRNLLIYLAPDLQKRVIPTFHYALNPNGYLLLGASETIGSFTDLFTLVDHRHRIYAKKTTAARVYPHFRTEGLHPGLPLGKRPLQAPGPGLGDWQREADRVVLGQYAPPGVLVNDGLDILQFRGDTSAYLKHPAGEASFNVLKMAREGLFLDLRSALAECRERNAEVRREGIRVHDDSGVRKFDLRVLPVRNPASNEHCFLILFEAASPGWMPSGAAERMAPLAGARSPRERIARWFSRSSPDQSAAGSTGGPDDEAARLRDELTSTREYLQSVIEEQDASNEELKSANEEVLSANEELQSTNEELETAKEELQSVNEELITINEQLQRRHEELSRLHDDLNNLLSSANVPMVAVGADLRIRRFTPSAAGLFNVLPTDVGRPIGNLRPAFDVSDLEPLIKEVIQNVRMHEHVVRDREDRHHLLRIHPYRTAGDKIDGAVVVLLDIEQVASQAARLRQKAALLELSSDAIIVRDRDSRIVFWNRGAADTYGWSQDEAIGKNAHELLQPGVPGAGAEIDAMLRGLERWQGELTHARRDSSQIVVESRQVAHRGEDGQVLAILEINRDITERKRLIDDLADKARELGAADKRKNEFLATLAHELRNPLTPMRNGMQILRLVGTEDRQGAEARDMVERNIGLMTRLIDDLLDLSRISRGQILLRKESVDMAETVREVVAQLKWGTDEARHEIALELPAQPMHVDADPVRIAQVVENLLHNAIRYTEDGGRIDILLTRAGSKAVLSVRDSGIGMSPENLARIWEPFVQLDPSAGRKRSGLGIGLALVRSLVELHGGTIVASSAGEGKGSEFVLKLPLAAGAPVRPKARRAGPAVLKGRRILIVDDNADVVGSMASLLKLMDNDVRTASSGAEALRTAREYRPEIVLLDIGLPGMNGYDVARTLRHDLTNGRMLIFAVSGYGSREDVQRSLEAGFDAHFVKPMEIADLQEFLTAGRADRPRDRR